jgi:hypothetical protein
LGFKNLLNFNSSAYLEHDISAWLQEAREAKGGERPNMPRLAFLKSCPSGARGFNASRCDFDDMAAAPDANLLRIELANAHAGRGRRAGLLCSYSVRRVVSVHHHKCP